MATASIAKRLKDPSLFRQQAFVNNEWVSAATSKTFEVNDPGNQEVIGCVPECNVNDVSKAISAADHAFQSWRNSPVETRYQVLNKWKSLMHEHAEDLAKIMTIENGKPLKEATGEVLYAASFLEWFSEEAKRIDGDIIPGGMPSHRHLVIKQPVGVVAIMTPWNFPTAMITRKVGAAIAAGCTTVVKPAAETPYSALALAELAKRAGVPPGVLNVVTSHENLRDVSSHLTTDPIVKKVSFTGSTRVGKQIMEQASSTLKRLSLELGGNAPLIVFEDADLDAAVKVAVACKFRNNGQTCVCANRLYVHDAIYDEFAQKFTQAVKHMRVGYGLGENIELGPLIHQGAMDKVSSFLRDAVDKGAKVQTGGAAYGSSGTAVDGTTNAAQFFQPTVLTEVTADMLVSSEEIFGPVAPLIRFKAEEEVLAWANGADVGLASYFFTRDLSRAWRVAEKLETGMIGVNTSVVGSASTPFGGIKQSGIGREGSKYGISEYLNIKYINMDIS
ncbi:succinate semialdehyde dehydrogenase NADP+ linked [Tieghemiomyces parasiticus]|uniref:Succinate-semialdehyde dehydrogenase n=1 Tax=Tieghemiomyces parasiticus TaxID=78921 RepID=A0A9W8DZK4_9FUNG|nr:succinate semialdehyde dehydrogenase NADP+ linked [Tieghemiomyces parasiticus]